jgi:CDP-diacylglycerol--serine O-phosphatidyltransferase
MSHAFLLLFIIVIMLLLERVLAVSLTRASKGREFIRRMPFLHPNAISLIRIPMGALSILLVHLGHWNTGVLWFAFWMITDLTDGTIARNCDLETETGKWLDPLSDKFMYFPCLLYLSLGPYIKEEVRLDIWGVALFIVIDTLGQASRLFSRKKAANYFGKAKTALVTILLSAVALYNIQPFPMLNSTIVGYLLTSCNILAFLSFYCKVIPDVWYANSLTFANFICGLAAIWVVCHYGWFTRGFVLIFVGQFFDLFDGRLARKFGSTKRGAFFDDVADGTSFGLAAGCIIYRGLNDIEGAIPTCLAAVLALFYIICLLYRLYRFLHPNRPQRKGVFQGMPSPAGALLACSAVLMGMRQAQPAGAIGAAVVVVIASCLMISNIPYLHFGQSLWPELPRAIKLLLLVVLVIFVNFVLVNKHDWEAAFIWFCSGLSLLYAIFAIKTRTHGNTETRTDTD